MYYSLQSFKELIEYNILYASVLVGPHVVLCYS